MNFIIQSVEIKMRPVYRCTTCGAQDLGERHTVQRRDLHINTSAGTLLSDLAPRSVSNNYMPDGWACFYRKDGEGRRIADGYHCPQCCDRSDAELRAIRLGAR